MLGDFGTQSSVAEQYHTLQQDLLAIYTREFIETWQQMLAQDQVEEFFCHGQDLCGADRRSLADVADPPALIERDPGRDGGDAPATEAAAAPGCAGSLRNLDPAVESAGLLQDGAPGAPIEQAFKGFYDMLAGDRGQPPHRPTAEVA